MSEGSPFCCVIAAMSKSERERYDELREKLENAVEETKELDRGFLFRLRGEVVSLIEVAEWMEKERGCCPFFDLAIEAERENGPVSLRITGREGVKEFIRGEFRVLRVG